MLHNLKIWPTHFQDVRAGIKTAEIRQNDRDYQPGDILVLREYDPMANSYTGSYTGEVETRTVTHVLADDRYLQPGMVMLSMSGGDRGLTKEKG